MTRFAGWPSLLARIVLAAVCALIAFGLLLSATPIGSERYLAKDPEKSDTALYRKVAERVAKSENYYEAAVAEHRLRDYPLKPFVTVRLPTSA